MSHLQRGLRRTRRAIDIPAWAIGAIQLEAWAKWPKETGGILLGRSSSKGATVHHVVGPGLEAVHARCGFTPDSDWQAERVAEAWTQDNSIEYLGDWHTHPGGTTRLSNLDKAAAVTICNYPDARQPTPIMFVLALRRDGSSSAAAAMLQDGRLRPLRITVPEA
jgi:integrative and conjugative element protein (TIGR02256 family)